MLEQLTDGALTGRRHTILKNFGEKHGSSNFWVPTVTSDAPVKHGGTRKVVDGVVLTHLPDVHRIYKEHVEKPPGYEDTFIGEGVLSVNQTDAWREQRARLKPAFSVKSLSALAPLVMAGAREMADTALAPAARAGKAVEMHAELMRLAFLLIGHAALGESDAFLKENCDELRAAFDEGFVPDWRTTEEGQAAERVRREFTRRVFANARAAKARTGVGDAAHAAAGASEIKATFRPHSVVGRLIESYDACPASDSDASPTTDLQHDELMTFQFAGHETTANTMTWCLYELARNPSVQQKLHAEIDAILPALRREHESAAGVAAVHAHDLSWLSYRQLMKFRYLTRIINETLRLWPVVANGSFRKLTHDDVVACPHGAGAGGEVRLPKGTVVQAPHWSIHRSKKLWGEDAELFRPDRKWKQRAFMPFTLPPRDCLGRNFAMMEMRGVLLTFLARFEVLIGGPPAGDDGSTREQTHGFNFITLRPENGMWLEFRERSIYK